MPETLKPVDREGLYRAQITEYALHEADSGAVSLSVKALLLEMWDENNKEWLPWNYDMEAQGFLNLIKKDGKLNLTQVNPMCKHMGWDGDFLKLTNQEWSPCNCQVKVTRDTYEGEERLRIAFINAWDRTPGQGGNVDESKAKALQARYGGDLRAVVGNLKANGAPAPAGKPPMPPPPNPNNLRNTLPPRSTADDIPFGLLIAGALASVFHLFS